jgi:uncharacterized protein YecE (DUF72 family)
MTEDQKADQDPLRFYQKYFSFVEINDTFYTEPTLPYFLDIQARSKESMLYSVKVHQNIANTKECEVTLGQDMMRRHITAVSPLIESGRFFSFLIQLNDQEFRTQKKLDFLLRVAGIVVSDRIDVHIEFRHISWHAEPVLTALKNAGVGICNTEIPRLEHVFPLKAYMRPRTRATSATAALTRRIGIQKRSRRRPRSAWRSATRGTIMSILTRNSCSASRGSSCCRPRRAVWPSRSIIISRPRR